MTYKGWYAIKNKETNKNIWSHWIIWQVPYFLIYLDWTMLYVIASVLSMLKLEHEVWDVLDSAFIINR